MGKKRPGAEKGIALFMVLWVLMLLSAIVTEFCFAMRTEVNMVRNFKEQTEAYFIAMAGLNRAILELVRNESTLKKKNPSPPENQDDQDDFESLNPWRMNTHIPSVPFAQGAFKVHIDNEAGKINLNTADESMLKMMLSSFELDEAVKNTIVDSILDWRDQNDLHRLNGAENDYYQSLEKSYECKNGDFDSVEELLMVRGVTPDIFYGGLNRMVTVFQDRGSKRGKVTRTERKTGGSKICINAASKTLLLSLPNMTEDLVQLIIDFRTEADFVSTGEISRLLGADVYGAISPYITLDASSYYQISSVGGIKGSPTKQGISAMVEINRSLHKGYRMVQWNDQMQIPEAFSMEP